MVSRDQCRTARRVVTRCEERVPLSDVSQTSVISEELLM